MTHTVSVKEIYDWMHKEAWYLAASSAGGGSLKKLEMNNSGVFRVTCHDDVTYCGDHLEAAVQAYNSAK